MYFLTLINSILLEYEANSEAAKKVDEYLVGAGLVEPSRNLTRLLKGVFDYVRSYFRPAQTVEGNIQIDPSTGLPVGFSGKISFVEPTNKAADVISVDSLLFEGNRALSDLEIKLWILLDRLDVAFAETPALEENALRALFRVYLDIMDLEHVSPKVFLRTDIWNRITQSGFREASHITRHITIRWDINSLINLGSFKLSNSF